MVSLSCPVCTWGREKAGGGGSESWRPRGVLQGAPAVSGPARTPREFARHPSQAQQLQIHPVKAQEVEVSPLISQERKANRQASGSVGGQG